MSRPRPSHEEGVWQPQQRPGEQVEDHLRPDSRGISGLTNTCFGCAPGNPHGLQLRFSEDLSAARVLSEFRIARRFEGPPGHVHGGIIATILDEAMGKVNRQKGVVALTRRMSVDYLRPVPLGVTLHAVGWAVRREGRKHFNAGEIRTTDGIVLARSEGLFIEIDPAKMFTRQAARRQTGRAASVETDRLEG